MGDIFRASLLILLVLLIASSVKGFVGTNVSPWGRKVVLDRSFPAS